MLGSLSDRLLSLVVPKTEASAGFCYKERANHDGRLVCRTCCVNTTYSCGNWSVHYC
ncbi:hypothetical protein [Nocardiopsis sp. NRRL B-16309]|uniref:hypothetical protein n=1 Tax=Nocardiopsis sp. NRRL B-16309 TaxID=1519494 RepID=UPI000B2DC02C|nr:hypothetical protein [Nocardiopsis sp. NRRL B-16309]